MKTKYIHNYLCFLGIITLFLTFSCKNDNHSKLNSNFFSEKEFPKQVSLSTDEKINITSVILKTNRIKVIDSFLVIYQDRKDTIFSIFKLPNLEFMRSFGNKGNGPDEFNLAFPTTFESVKNGFSSFAMGNKMNNVQYYNIDDIINNKLQPYKIAKLPPKLNGFRAIAYVGDSLIYGAPYAGGNIDIFKYHVDDNNLENYSEYPDEYPLMDSEVKRELYGCYITTKNDNTKFARVYSNIGKIEIYDISDEHKDSNLLLGNKDAYELSYEDFPSLKENLKLEENSKQITHTGERKVFSWGIASNNKYIYVEILNNHYNKIVNSSGYIKEFIPEIHIFDWEGKPIAKLYLDNHFSFYDVDNDGKYLYTVSLLEENIIRRYYIGDSYSPND